LPQLTPADILDEMYAIEDINGFPVRNYYDEWEGKEDFCRAKLTRPHISSTMTKLVATGSSVAPVVYIACCLQLGVRIHKKDLRLAERYVRYILQNNEDNEYIIGQYAPVLQAIKDYKNDGETAWEPRELGLLLTMSLGQELAQA
jgi:hypothetical protein